MGCIFVLIALLLSRLALVLMWIFTPWVDRDFGPLIWPILGHLPAANGAALRDSVEYGGQGDGLGVDLLILAVFVDVASHGLLHGGARPSDVTTGTIEAA